jgi:hypothetical protein
MACATATFPVASRFDGPVSTLRNRRRGILAGVVIGLGTLVAACVVAALVIVVAAWIIAAVLSTNPYIHARASIGPETMAVNNRAPAGAAVADLSSSAPVLSDRNRAPDAAREAELAPEAASAAAPVSTPAGTAPAAPTRTPEPAKRVQAAPPAAAAALPPASTPRKPLPAQQAHDDANVLPGPDSRTAVYDIAAHTVYLPGGDELEAHSGLGRRLDDPRSVGEKNRGPTPPNVYDLVLRGAPFHGVRAIRLNPVGDGNMFGRDGMLAHTYMLGPSGQSFGCVSFKNYAAFLQAFLRGEVDHLVVVPHLSATASRSILARHGHGDRYAFDHR